VAPSSPFAGWRRFGANLRLRRYVFTVAAGIVRILPAVEPGILPGGDGVWSGKALAIGHLRSGGKMPPSTAAKMAAATHLLRLVNTFARQRTSRTPE